MRKAGILLPIFSLPSKYGIGTFGRSAYEFVDFLKKAGQSYWQILPMGPTSYGDSPYQSFSTFAGNPYFIDLELICEDGLLNLSECEEYEFGSNPQYVDYPMMYKSRFDILKVAFERMKMQGIDEKLEKFKEKNNFWLEDYSLYMAIKGHFDSHSWQEWDDDIKKREPQAVKHYKEKFENEMEFWAFLQYQFHKQWNKLKKYANENNISIIGDLPIYVALDSADCWCNTKLFEFDENFSPKQVAGCPPDGFSATGQLWGNPLYDWDKMKATGYLWWLRRIGHAFNTFDKVRIDHFRGFDEYYCIPAEDKTAENGKWKKGPGYPFFQLINETFGELDIIAEDLGFLTEGVYKLLEDTGFPGMKVLQFAFDCSGESTYLPHKYDTNSIVYTGTHDNDTTQSWYETQTVADRNFCKQYVGVKSKKNASLAFIRVAYECACELAIVPIQDFLCLGNETRINYPSTLGYNWEWRLSPNQLTNKFAKRLYKYTKMYDRLPVVTEVKNDEIN